MPESFIFGKIVESPFFIDREMELERLSANIKNNINTILISPRRWGKSSLIKKLSSYFEDYRKIKFCTIDLYGIRSEDEFYTTLSTNIIRAVSSKIDEIKSIVSNLLKSLKPSIVLDAAAGDDFRIEMEFREVSNNYKEILNLAENLARKKNIRIIICIDEFQNINYFDNPLSFQKRCRSVWQTHSNVTYILYGSKKSMLNSIFNDSAMPFYRFGELFFLNKIDSDILINYIIERFKATNKFIDEKKAMKIVSMMECIPYYVQQLAYIVWNRTKEKVTKQVLDYSLDDIVNQNHYLYSNTFDSLSNKQVLFLKALIDGVESGYSRKEVIDKYNLGSSANVIKIINVLIGREIIDKENNKYIFLDPVFRLWLKKLYYGIH